MNGKVFGALVAGAVLALSAGSARAADEGDKACYRKSCGDSIKGHSGTCAGSKAGDLKSEKDCTAAGGAWLSADEAKKLKH